MSNNSSPKNVLVGIDGTPAGHRGVRYAALEARQLGTGLTILHVTAGYSMGAGLPPVPEDVLRDYGLELLEKACQSAQAVVPGLAIDTQLLAGMTTVHGLVSRSESAVLLVLGAERRSFAGRIWTGDTVAGVAAQASCPVVIVPPEWEPGHEFGRIVVGVKSTDEAEGLIAAGLATAHRRGAELVIMHAWKLASGYDDIIGNRVSVDEYGTKQTAALEPLVHAHRSEYPEVPVRIEVLHTQPAQALMQTSAAADRLLISRPHHGGAMHRLGNIGRAVLHEARCPVEVHAPEQPRGEHQE